MATGVAGRLTMSDVTHLKRRSCSWSVTSVTTSARLWQLAGRQTACFKLATHSSLQVHWARSLRRAAGWSREASLPPLASHWSRGAAPYCFRTGTASRWQAEPHKETFLFTCAYCRTTSTLCIQTWMCFVVGCHSNMYRFRLKGA